MWYELIPFFGVMFAGVALPCVVTPISNYVFNKGHVQSRNLYNTHWEFIGYTRDNRLTGSVYKAVGLESDAIPEVHE